MVNILSYSKQALQAIDIYGQKIELNFKKQNTYKTTFGGILTFIIFSFFCIGCWFYGKELVYKEKPSVISSQRPVISPQRIDVKPNNFIVMISVTDNASKPFNDPTIFTVRAGLERLQLYNDSTTGRIKRKLVQEEKKIRNCGTDDIGISDLKDYFKLVNLPVFFCFDEQQEVFMEGDFDADKFSQMYVYVDKCKNSTSSQIICKPAYQIDEILKLTRVQIYMSDKNINPLNFQEPISNRGILLFSQTSSFFPKELQFYFTNQFIESDVGIMYEQIETKQSFLFVEMKETPFFSDPNVLARFIFRLQKQKENLMQRRYQKLADVIAQIGGLLKILTTLGTLISFPISKLYLMKAIVDEIFQFESTKGVELIQKNFTRIKSSQALSSPQSPVKKGNKKISKTSKKSQIEDKQKPDIYHEIGVSNNIPVISAITSVNQSICQSPPLFPQNLQLNYELQSSINPITQINGISLKLEQLVIKAKEYFQYQHKVIKYTFTNFFSHAFLPKLKRIRKEYKLVQEGVTKMQDHLDVLFVLNKLMEIDKIKAILLNSNQLNLFEYIPKPIISDDDVTDPQKIRNEIYQNSYNEIKINNNNIQQNISNLSMQKEDIKKANYNNNNTKNKLEKVYSLYRDSKNDTEKAQDAYQGFQNLLKQSKLSKIDQNLINLISPAILQSIQDLNRNFDIQNEEQSFIYPNSRRDIIIPNSSNLIKKIDQKSEYDKKINYFQPYPQMKLDQRKSNSPNKLKNNFNKIQSREFKTDQTVNTPQMSKLMDSTMNQIIDINQNQDRFFQDEKDSNYNQVCLYDSNQIYFANKEDESEEINKQSIYESNIKIKQVSPIYEKIKK